MTCHYVTTPIYYVNDVPHLGTSYSTIVVDALRRYHLMRGRETRMLTGTDEHGLKLEREARARGIAPADFVREMSDRFASAWPKLEVEADDFLRTTEPRHVTRVQWLWEEIRRRHPSDIYLGHYEGWYCVGCEELKTEKELEQPGNVCPLHKKPVERVKEQSYFFRLSAYQDRLLAHYASHRCFIEPEARRNEIVSFVQGGLRDLSISRTTFTWGIPVPGDPAHVVYVWFDALANYWTALQDSSDHKKFWGPDANIVHVIGKDILRFHAVYWPAILMSAGLDLPTTVFAHGFLTFNGQKMSKALRNSVDPLKIARVFGAATGGDDAAGAEVLRYQLLRSVSLGQDGDFDLPAMIERYNADLGNNLGNLLARTLGLCVKMTATRVPAKGNWTTLEDELYQVIEEHRGEALAAWERIEPHRALERTWAIASAANQYVDRAAPWTEAKKGNTGRVGTILNMLVSVLGLLSELIWPALPSKSDAMRAQLGLLPIRTSVGTDRLGRAFVPRDEGAALSPGAPLFPTTDSDGTRALLDALTPRIDAVVDEAGAGGPVPGPSAKSEANVGVTYDQFSAVELRVGLVLSAARVPKKDKLLKVSVDLGEEGPRTIIAGLALTFEAEALVGRRVVVVSNLLPRDFGKGLVSHGMLLATGPSEKLVLATVDGDAAPGARLK